MDSRNGSLESCMNDRRRREIVLRIAEEMKNPGITRSGLEAIKTRLASGLCIEVPPNKEILSMLKGRDRERWIGHLLKKPGRTASGISIVAVMAKPEKCPHGTCVYCPTVEGVPQSYVQDEPAVMRAKALGYDSLRQTRCRIRQLKDIGHPASKVELVVMGGTFTSRPAGYQRDFIKGCYDGLNGRMAGTLAESVKANEKAAHRCVGLTIETRPDYVAKSHIGFMLSFCTTRVEIGVQNPDDAIYRKIRRGHTVMDVIESTSLLKDSGLKVCYHIMPNLPGSDCDKDLAMFRSLFSDERFRPDMIKLYPALVVGGSELAEMFRKGEYETYTDEKLIGLLAEMKRNVPEYVRIMRLQRDVPSQHIIGGCRFTNLREIVLKEMGRRGLRCRCIRCREIRDRRISMEDIEKSRINTIQYDASGGKEHFLQYVTRDGYILGLLRMRFPSSPFLHEVTESTALVRELRVFGPSTPVGARISSGVQHKGIGKKLLSKAEEIAGDSGMDKIMVTSGAGAREYYRRFGYANEGYHMGKAL